MKQKPNNRNPTRQQAISKMPIVLVLPINDRSQFNQQAKQKAKQLTDHNQMPTTLYATQKMKFILVLMFC